MQYHQFYQTEFMGKVLTLSHLPFPDFTSDLEFLKRGNKCRSRNEGCEKVHQTDSNPGPMISSPTLTTRLPTAAAKSTENLWYLCTVLINAHVAGPDPDPDPNPRGGGQPPNVKSVILR